MTDEISALKTLRVGSFSLSVITLYIIVSGIANIILLHLLHGPLCTLQTLFFFSPYIAMIVGAYYVLKLSLGFLKLNTNACIKLGFIGGIFMIISLIIAALFPVFSIVSFHPIYKANAISNEQAAKIIVTSLILIFTTALSIFLFLIGNVFLGIGFYGVGERYKNSLVSIGGIIGIILPFIGYFITYAGLSKVIKQLIT